MDSADISPTPQSSTHNTFQMDHSLSWTTDDNPNFSFRRKIAAGGFGTVYEIFDNTSGKAFARKIISLSLVDPKTIENEARAIAKLCNPSAHENIVAVLRKGYLLDDTYFFYDMELCKMNLNTYISRTWKDPVPEELQHLTMPLAPREKLKMAMYIMLDIAEGVSYIHRNREVHRDLKPENVLYSSEKKTWKIGDFGLTVSGTSKNPITTNEARGTTCYRAPEIVKELSTYNNKVDIWAIGCIAYELTTERRAFTNDLDVVGWGNTDQEKTIPTDIILDNIPKQFISQIIRKCLRAEPNERPTAKSICNWLREFLGLEANESSKLELTSEPSSIILNEVPSGSGSTESESNSPTSRTRSIIRRPVPATKDDIQVKWNMVRSHMPPWMNFEGKVPTLCDEFRLRIELSGKGHAERTSRVTATKAYCALFTNMLVFCQATFVTEDETSPYTPSDASSLGFVFLQNLTPKALNQKPQAEKRRTSGGSVSFALNLSTNDTLTFILTLDGMSLSHAWQEALKKSLSSGSTTQVADDSAFIQVRFLKVLAEFEGLVQYRGSPGEFGQFAAKLSNDKTMFFVYLLQPGDSKSIPELDRVFTAAHRLKILNLVVKTFENETQFHRRGFIKSWTKWLASANGLQALSNAFVDVDEANNANETQLHWAAYLGFSGLIESLLKGGIINKEAKNSFQETSLHLAAQNGGEDVVAAIVEGGADLGVKDKLGCTALHHASANGRLDAASVLLEAHHSLLDILNSRGFTALHSAAHSNRVDLLQLLLDSGADVNVRSGKNGPTALHSASSRGHIETVKILLQTKADVTLKDHRDHGRTALHSAATRGHAEVSRLLLKANAGVSEVDFSRDTPLHLAAREGHIEVVKVLLEARANIKAKNNLRDTPVDVTNNLAVLQALREFKQKMKSEMNGKDKKGKDCSIL